MPDHPSPPENLPQVAEEDTGVINPEPPYSAFTPAEKYLIVIMASAAALFSPLSANIYYPALPTLANDLNVSYSLINLTITTYLIFQGLAPTFVGSISDEIGRRPAYIACFVIYIAANIGLALQSNYAALMVLRCVQSSGSSGTVALANAAVSDFATSAERGSLIGYVSIGALLGPAIGPVIGGLLCQYLGWRATFWFLTIFGGVVFIVILVVLPETCRNVVGNGSIPAQKWNRSLLSYIKLRKQRRLGTHVEKSTIGTAKKRPNLLSSVYILLDKESGILLLCSGLLFAGFYMVLASLPAQLAEHYKFNTVQVGLCYIPAGVGSMVAAVGVGRLLDWNFRRHAIRLGMEISKNKQQDLTNFPIETARLQIVLPNVLLAAATVIIFGWVLQHRTNLAGPLIALFFSTFAMTAAFQGMSTLIIDLNRSSPGSATAAMNLARCWLGAGAVAFVDPMITAIGIGWTGVLIGGVWVLIGPMILMIMKYGPRWREEKLSKQGRKASGKTIAGKGTS